MVVIVIIQLIISGKQIRLSEEQNKLAADQYKESRLKHIEAEEVLKKAEFNAKLAFSITSSNFHKTRIMTDNSKKLIVDANLKVKRTGEEIDFLRKETATELASLKKRNQLTTLADTVIASGDRNTFLKLHRYAAESKDIAGISEVLRVKSFFFVTDRFGKIDLDAKTELGLIKDVSTESIVVSIKAAKNWEFRGKCVKVLGLRKEKVAIEALLDVIKNDDNLAVMKAALDSFSELTGYESLDIFDNLPDLGVFNWWKINKDKIKKELK